MIVMAPLLSEHDSDDNDNNDNDTDNDSNDRNSKDHDTDNDNISINHHNNVFHTKPPRYYKLQSRTRYYIVHMYSTCIIVY